MQNLLANSTIDIRTGIEQFSEQPVQTSLTPVIADVINAAIIIGALLFLVFLVLGAVGWITAGGDKGKIEGARAKITQGFVGLVVLVFAYTFYVFALNYLGIDLGQGSSGSSSSGSVRTKKDGPNWIPTNTGEKGTGDFEVDKDPMF